MHVQQQNHIHVNEHLLKLLQWYFTHHNKDKCKQEKVEILETTALHPCVILGYDLLIIFDSDQIHWEQYSIAPIHL